MPRLSVNTNGQTERPGAAVDFLQLRPENCFRLDVVEELIARLPSADIVFICNPKIILQAC